MEGAQVDRTVVVDPRFNVPYYTYVLEGFSDAGYQVRYSKLREPKGGGLSLLAEGRKIWLDTTDIIDFDDEPYEWADVVGKVNTTSQLLANFPKLIPLGPVFSIRTWELPRGYLAWLRLVWAGAPARSSLAGVRFQGITRLPMSTYRPSTSEVSTYFHRSRPWSGRWAGTNDQRERFIKALDSLGLAGDAMIVEERTTLTEYVARTARSTLVFNSPAVVGCLGWKLGEYLALGKAIISVDLKRELPEPLVHGRHIHFVDDDVDAIRDAIVVISQDHEYRRNLEQGAREWFDRNLRPASVVDRLLHP